MKNYDSSLTPYCCCYFNILFLISDNFKPLNGRHVEPKMLMILSLHYVTSVNFVLFYFDTWSSSNLQQTYIKLNAFNISIPNDAIYKSKLCVKSMLPGLFRKFSENLFKQSNFLQIIS